MAERVGESCGEECGEFVSLLVGESCILSVALRILEVYLFVGYIEVAAQEEWFFAVEFLDIITKGIVPIMRRSSRRSSSCEFGV